MEKIDYFLIIIGSVAATIIGLLLLKQAVPLHWQRLTLPTTTWGAYVVLLLLPSIGIAVFEEPPEGYLTLSLILSAALTIPIGVLAANAAWRFRRRELEDFYAAEIKPLSPWEQQRLLILTGLILLFSMLFFWETGSIPLLQAFFHAGEYDLLARLRQGVTNDLRSPFNYLYFMIRQFGWALILSCWLGVGWTTRWTVKYWMMFLLLLAFGLFYCSATLTRSPAVVLFIVMFFFYYLFRSARIPVFTVFIASILALSIPIFILFLHDPSRSWESIGIGLYQRIFYTPAKLNFQYIEIFSKEKDFLYGRGIGKLSSLVGMFDPAYEYFPISQEVYERIFPNSPYRGSAPASFVGMAYANWGVFGPPLYGLLIGFILQSIQIWLARRRKNLFVLAVHAALFYSFFEVNRTDFFAALFSYGGLVLPVFLVLLQAKRHRPSWFLRGTLSCGKAFSGQV